MDNALAEQQLKLMQAVANGDRRAFEQLYRLTSPHLFAVALRMLRHRAWAEEILHDCFVTVSFGRRHRHTFSISDKHHM